MGEGTLLEHRPTSASILFVHCRVYNNMFLLSAAAEVETETLETRRRHSGDTAETHLGPIWEAPETHWTHRRCIGDISETQPGHSRDVSWIVKVFHRIIWLRMVVDMFRVQIVRPLNKKIKKSEQNGRLSETLIFNVDYSFLKSTSNAIWVPEHKS